MHFRKKFGKNLWPKCHLLYLRKSVVFFVSSEIPLRSRKKIPNASLFPPISYLDFNVKNFTHMGKLKRFTKFIRLYACRDKAMHHLNSSSKVIQQGFFNSKAVLLKNLFCRNQRIFCCSIFIDNSLDAKPIKKLGPRGGG